ncbi:MAG: anhydro-N-acetylmuramic acid kinase [Bacteroidales bacterium]|nr:anhydro-N-acetylmuramic acid kinase [Bacteroidales bacterium]
MNILGLMSGTSLDGVDLALCALDRNSYSILAAETVPYPAEWRQRLSSLERASALEYAKSNVELGHYFGKIINQFIDSRKLAVDAIASHGHTIFHQPALGLTTQIGDGDAIAAETGLPVVSNFRTLDVALGGQGAPLVPIGDELFFGQYDACLNLGGIANISYRHEGKRIAFDICPCNMALNRLAARLGLEYDRDGETARRGMLNERLNERLNMIEYYAIEPPKSLGKEWFVEEFWPLLEASSLPTEDLLATVTRHIAGQVAQVLHREQIGTLLVTGGGALNRYLVECIRDASPEVEVTIPDRLIVNYKEALIFALLGYLRLKGEVNTLASVTGARCDSVGGTVSGHLMLARRCLMTS